MRPLPISREEFARFFQATRPPPGWPARIGVANSGGPDSTCLLFLIQRYIKDSTPLQTTSPAQIYSLTIDHALQASSAAMAEQSSLTAKNLDIPHTTARIPWGVHPFPRLPDKSESFENTARLARYHLLWKWMRTEGIDAVAMAHHADDQVETALMRLGRESSQLGGRGMLACRRWGMGMKNDLEWAGFEGMSKWIIRPLLEVPKDRILATCEENGLSYVTDSTNFQPNVTLRNALRAIISSNDKGESPPNISTLHPKTEEYLSAINRSFNTLSHVAHLPVNIKSSSENLRAAVKVIDLHAGDIENQASSLIARIRLSSPPGTFILSTRSLQSITEPLLQRAVVLRILRYISFHPWGSLQAQARRSKHSLDQMITRLWDPDLFFSLQTHAFVAGGGVLWIPVLVDAEESKTGFLDDGGRIKRPDPEYVRQAKSIGKGFIGWMATRQPPMRPDRLMEYGLEDTLNVELSPFLRTALKEWDDGKGAGPAIAEFLWDCRFLLRFDLAKVPQSVKDVVLNDTSDGHKLAIRFWSRYFYPKVVIIPPGNRLAWDPSDPRPEVVLHSTIDSHRASLINLLLQRTKNKSVSPRKKWGHGAEEPSRNTPLITSSWVHASWIRTLDQI